LGRVEVTMRYLARVIGVSPKLSPPGATAPHAPVTGEAIHR
jgi:hypothetical protein